MANGSNIHRGSVMSANSLVKTAFHDHRVDIRKRLDEHDSADIIKICADSTLEDEAAQIQKEIARSGRPLWNGRGLKFLGNENRESQ